jgi:hypothetical protein
MECTENLAAHRMQQILAILPTALVAGVAELDPEIEPLKVSMRRWQADGANYECG